ncbi:MAG: M55 family metallopeptidase [Desulfobacterales bacterium]
MRSRFKRVLIIADIEGSSGCWNYQASSFMTPEWANACVEMSRDVNTIVRAMFGAGIEEIRIKDFHRTGYNLLPELIDTRAKVIHGYHPRPVPGIGDPGISEAVMFIGMHAASGTDGFLAHTLTSRIQQLKVNGKPLSEVELFAASLAPFGVKPIFFSGCPVACQQALIAIANISVHPIEKSQGPDRFNVDSWREGLSNVVVASLQNQQTEPYQPSGPFDVMIKMRDGKNGTQRIAQRWRFDSAGDQIRFSTATAKELYMNLIRICYLTPSIEKILPVGLIAYNLWGRVGLGWLRRYLNRLEQC